MRWLIALALITAGLAGCLGEEISPGDGLETQAARAREDAGPATWNLTGTVDIGWMAGMGTGSFLGDDYQVAGNSQGTCPEATFRVPGGTSSLSLSIEGGPVGPEGPGAGSMSIFVRTPDDEVAAYLDGSMAAAGQGNAAYEASSPEAGTWMVESVPEGAVVNQIWSITVALDGSSATPPDEVGFNMPTC